jgi:hypothetical protein
MEVLDKFDGDEDLTLIPPEDGVQTDEKSGDEVDGDMFMEIICGGELEIRFL